MNYDAPPKEGQKAQRGAFRGALRGFEGRPSKEGRVGQSVATRVNCIIYNALVTVIHTDYCTPVYVILTVIGTLWTDQ